MKALDTSFVVAQVQNVYSDRNELGVVLPHYGSIQGINVKVAHAFAHPDSGQFVLPQMGDVGLVLFTHNDARSGVWIATLPSALFNVLPLEIWEDDPEAKVTYERGGKRTIQFSNGDLEQVLPDNTLIRHSHSKDGTISNEQGRVKRTPMVQSTDPDGNRNAVRSEYEPEAKAPVDMVIDHSSGTQIRISADGNVFAETKGGYRLELREFNEQGRNDDGLSTGIDETKRGIFIETPQKKGVKIQENQLDFQWDDENQLRITSQGAELKGKTASISLKSDGVYISSTGSVHVDAQALFVGEGGVQLAKFGDSVLVNPATGQGVITTASAKVYG